MSPRSKYGNKKVVVDGHKFDSKREAERYCELKLLQKAGEIYDLQMQVPFVLQDNFTDVEGKRHRAIYYVADFTYYEGGKLVVEDVKSKATAKDKVYQLKKKMMAYNGYIIREVIR